MAITVNRSKRWVLALAIVLLVYAVAAGMLAFQLPFKDGAPDWFEPLFKGGWMAWSFPTALFFLTIFLLIALMGVWEYASPGGNPRFGILRFETTRGDRLFLSLLGSAFICLGWLGLTEAPLQYALIVCAAWALLVFRLV